MATLDEMIPWFESLSKEKVDRVREFYAEDASFRDPFNDVRGRDAITRVFAHMFEQASDIRIEVHERFEKPDAAVITWTFWLRPRGMALLQIPGATHLRFNERGLVIAHRDYWDVAEELYAKVPAFGALMRWLQRRLRTPL